MPEDNMLVEEDELLDRCMEFASLLTHSHLKPERDVLFEFIHTAVMMRIKEQVAKENFTRYPTLHECMIELGVNPDKLVLVSRNYVRVQQRFVNKVLEELKKKGSLSMIGSRYA